MPDRIRRTAAERNTHGRPRPGRGFPFPRSASRLSLPGWGPLPAPGRERRGVDRLVARGHRVGRVTLAGEGPGGAAEA